MKPILSAIFSLITFRFRSRASLELEVIALRHQLEVLRRKHHYRLRKRPWFRDGDKILWAWLYMIWPRAKKLMTLVSPDTVVRWHHDGFCFYWRVRKIYRAGNKKLDPEIRS